MVLTFHTNSFICQKSVWNLNIPSMILQCDVCTFFMTAIYKSIKGFCIPTPLQKQCTAHLPESLHCLLDQTDHYIKTALANFRNSAVSCMLHPNEGESSFGQTWSFSWHMLILIISQGTVTQHTKSDLYIYMCAYMSIKINYKSISLSLLKAESTFLFSLHKTWQFFTVRFLKQYICLYRNSQRIIPKSKHRQELTKRCYYLFICLSHYFQILLRHEIKTGVYTPLKISFIDLSGNFL